jgi:hypothetical protein
VCGSAGSRILLSGNLSRVLGASLWAYCRDTYVRSIPSTIVLILLLTALSNHNEPDGYVLLLGQALVSAVSYAFVAYFTLLTSEERKFVPGAKLEG